MENQEDKKEEGEQGDEPVKPEGEEVPVVRELTPRERSLANLIPFKKGYNPLRNINGRSKKLTTIAGHKGYKKSQVVDAINILLSIEEDELREINDNPDSTVLEKIVSGALLESIKKKSLWNLETLLTRIYGAPKQEVDNNINITRFDVRFNSDPNQLPTEGL